MSLKARRGIACESKDSFYFQGHAPYAPKAHETAAEGQQDYLIDTSASLEKGGLDWWFGGLVGGTPPKNPLQDLGVQILEPIQTAKEGEVPDFDPWRSPW